MKLLVNIHALGVDPAEQDDDKLKDEIFSGLKTAYKDEKSDAYLRESYDATLGRVNPTKFITMAKAWNDDLIDGLELAMKAVKSVAQEAWPTRKREMDDLADAARCLSDRWWHYAPWGIYAENDSGYPWFHCVTSVKELIDIEANPQDWAILTVYPD